MSESREFTLDEYVELLEISHRARHELFELRTKLAKAQERIKQLESKPPLRDGVSPELWCKTYDRAEAAEAKVKELETMLSATEAELVVAIADYRELEEEIEAFKEHDHEAMKTMEARAFIWKQQAERYREALKRIAKHSSGMSCCLIAEQALRKEK